MQGAKKFGVIAALAVIIVAAGVFAIKQVKTDVTKPPQWYFDRPIEKIEPTSSDVITKSYGEWLDLGEKDGKFKNPKTGAYVMTDAIVCVSCSQTVPGAPIPKLPEPYTRENEESYRQARNKAISEYKCPKCGKFPYAAGSY